MIVYLIYIKDGANLWIGMQQWHCFSMAITSTVPVIRYYGVLMDCQRPGWPLLQLRQRDCIIDFQAFTLPDTL